MEGRDRLGRTPSEEARVRTQSRGALPPNLVRVNQAARRSRQTQSKRMTRKLKELRARAKQLMHAPVAAQHRWLCSVLRGHYAYYGLPSNFRSMVAFRWEVVGLWYRVLRRRERRRTFTWSRFDRMLKERFPLPRLKITHPRQPA